jgi:hypothetical protein
MRAAAPSGANNTIMGFAEETHNLPSLILGPF